jgi:hypothetical protein
MKSIFCLMIFFTVCAHAQPKGNSMELTWFKDKNCSQLDLLDYRKIGNQNPVRMVMINDREYIKRLIAEIETMPVDGREMIKMGPEAEYATLKFTCSGGDSLIKIYAKMFQSPGTGYSSSHPADKKLSNEIYAILQPKLGNVNPKIRDLAYDFKTFSLRFTGDTEVDHAPATIQTHTQTFVLKIKDKPEQVIEVKSTQSPPPPVQFKVGAKKHTLYTYESAKGERLYPHYFQVK